jgi:hypothetical protein
MSREFNAIAILRQNTAICLIFTISHGPDFVYFLAIGARPIRISFTERPAAQCHVDLALGQVPVYRGVQWCQNDESRLRRVDCTR